MLVKIKEIIVILNQIIFNQDEIKQQLASSILIDRIEWIYVSNVADSKGLTPDAVRKQLQNGDFEEGLDFRYKGARIQIHQGAIERISRKRRSSNVK